MLQVDRNDSKTTWIALRIASALTLFSRSGPYSQTSKECPGERDEEVISETEAYFVAKDKSFSTKGIELLEKRWNQCITREGDYVDE